MPSFPRWPDSFPLAGRTLIVLLAAFLLAGMLGHDPWKSDDVVFIAIARGLADGGDWLLPQLAGERWLDAPPLFAWIAAVAGQIFSIGGLLAWHDAARMATFAFAAAGLAALTDVARRCRGDDAALVAPLLAFGTLGLLVPLHDAQPAVIGFAALATLLASLAAWDMHPRVAPVTLATALAAAFLGVGLDGFLPLAAITLLAASHPHWRRRSSYQWVLAVGLSITFLAVWPIALAIFVPGSFGIWWRNEVAALAGGGLLVFFRIEQFAWASWPAFPLALWTLWLERKRLGQWNVYLPLVAVLATLVHYLHAREPSTALVPLLASLVLFAAVGAGRLRRGAANAFDWFGAMTLTLFMALVWLGGIAILTGLPERVAKNFSKPAPGFIPEWSWPALAVAVIVTLAWLRLLATAPKSPWRAASRWSLGVGALWILLACLWLPWIDYGKSYRPVSADFRRALGDDQGCIERENLGPALRASLDYFDHIRTAPPGTRCDLRIVLTKPQTPTAVHGWRLILVTARPGDRSESLRLYRRVP